MYLVFFDESGKLDRNSEVNSYYGSLGCTKETYDSVSNYIKQLNFKNELHFNALDLKKLDRYLKSIDFVLDNEVSLNIFIVNRIDAEKTAKKLAISMNRMRELFYTKIPERLIYGIIRNITDYKTIKIVYDKCDEYEKYDLKIKLEHQLNAHAVYRNLSCQISEVCDEKSENECLLQVIDVILGLTTFLIDKKYYAIKEDLDNKNELDYILGLPELTEEEKRFISESYTEKKGRYILNIKSYEDKVDQINNIYHRINQFNKGSIQRSEFIYLLLDSPYKIKRMQKISIFGWNGNNQITRINIAEFIAEFYQYKVKFDDYNKTKMLKLYKDSPNLTLEDYRKFLGFGTSLDKLVLRYMQELGLQFFKPLKKSN